MQTIVEEITMDADASQNFDDSDLESFFYSALSMMGISDYTVHASFKPFASVKHNASVNRVSMELVAEVSDAYRLSSREVMTGLALDMCGRLFRKKIDNGYVRAYREFSKKGALFRLSDSIRMMRGRKRRANHVGKYHDLRVVGAAVMEKYRNVLMLDKMPDVYWNDRGGKRTLAFYDRAFDSVMVSRIFDAPNVPGFVLEYLCFHEFLHSKYKPLYERGKSRRVIVHSHAFLGDEKKFEKYEEADAWLGRNVRHLHLD
jgi:hypothetical protein